MNMMNDLDIYPLFPRLSYNHKGTGIYIFGGEEADGGGGSVAVVDVDVVVAAAFAVVAVDDVYDVVVGVVAAVVVAFVAVSNTPVKIVSNMHVGDCIWLICSMCQ